MIGPVDVILLSRDPAEPGETVKQGLAAQEGVRLNLHRVIGTPRADDSNRWATIARARNEGKRLGSAPWVIYLDDDVILGPGCVARLIEGLRSRPRFAALAADYLGEMAATPGMWDYPRHVAMGATLFRRDRLALIRFRWEPGKCECLCACDDLRRSGFGVGYLPEAKAHHRPIDRPRIHTDGPEDFEQRQQPRAHGASSGRVLAAFDRRHLQRFRRQFLGSLRASGNNEPVTAVGYGLFPSEQRALAAMTGVEVVAVPHNGVHPAIRRLRDFQEVIDGWPDETSVAYWDAGDVIFQHGLAPLWDLVRSNPDKVLAVREPTNYPENHAIKEWTETIIDPEARRHAFELLSTHPFYNAGFAAGTARALGSYLRAADRILHSTAVRGTRDFGDQTAMNLFCHTNPKLWHDAPIGWNYCLFSRADGYHIRPGGRIESRDGTPVYVVHGNARQLRHTELSFIA